MDKNFNIFVKTGFILCALSVALGAFGSHYLSSLVQASDLVTFDTGTKYMLYHGIAVSFLALHYRKFQENILAIVMFLFVMGIPFFTGSLYFLVFSKAFSFKASDFFIALTPIGGAFFISGWLLLAFKGLKKGFKTSSSSSSSFKGKSSSSKRKSRSSSKPSSEEVVANTLN